MADGVEPLVTVRVGQLTATTNQRWPDLVDAEGWPVLTDTEPWGLWGVDLGANTEHPDNPKQRDSRLYIFFGDVAEISDAGVPVNADLVAWTDDRTVRCHGGHQAQGWRFILPNDHQGATSAIGQPDWRFCSKCNGLFWAPEGGPVGATCPMGGLHDPLGWSFYLPSREGTGATDAVGQSDWRFCSKCNGLFWAPAGDATGTVCPAGSQHDPLGWTFYLPSQETGASEESGQPEWRFCAWCHGLFYNGYPSKGLCPGAPGGGFHLSAVLNERGGMDPFSAPEPIGYTASLETPSGAFSFGGAAYVFAGISERRYSKKARPLNPTYGCYLFSKQRPDLPGPFHTELLLSPRIGCCPRDASQTAVESHDVLGLRFVLPHSSESGDGWRVCSKCQSLFWADSDQSSFCHEGGSHTPDGPMFVLNPGAEGAQYDGGWFRCGRCAMLFQAGSDFGLCPAGGSHAPRGAAVAVPYATFDEGPFTLDRWRFCIKCAGLFRGDFSASNVCPADAPDQAEGHKAEGFEYVLPHSWPAEEAHHQGQWRCCKKCGGMFWVGAQKTSRCPFDHLVHEPADDPLNNFEYFLPHDLQRDSEHQDGWRFCTKCSGMFWNGDTSFRGACPAGGSHTAAGNNFVFMHNPGGDSTNQDGWRRCTRCGGLVFTGHPDWFSAVAPCVVRTAEHPYLPLSSAEWAVVMLGFGRDPVTAFRLAWLPLWEDQSPRLENILYYTGNPDGEKRWSADWENAAELSKHKGYTSVSLSWLEGPRRWMFLYSNANDEGPKPPFDCPVVARFGQTPWAWSEPHILFDPKQGAYGLYMHKDGLDDFNNEIPPLQPEPKHDGWAYGAYMLDRYTEWDESRRELGIYYLLSLSSPYQPQLMHTRLRVANEPEDQRE